jgi:hypothetical protein
MSPKTLGVSKEVRGKVVEILADSVPKEAFQQILRTVEAPASVLEAP